MNDNSFLDSLPNLSENECKIILKHLKSKSLEDKRSRFMEYTVSPTGSNKLVVGNNSTTWISLSNEIANNMTNCYMDLLNFCSCFTNRWCINKRVSKFCCFGIFIRTSKKSIRNSKRF